MKKRLSIILIALLLLAGGKVAMATHIVGGSLTYVYNGGSSYTITLKLYRDCGPGNAIFPDPVSISVRANDGSTSSFTLDFDDDDDVTRILANLPACAAEPSPMPCVEEGVYTVTRDFPSGVGGYHLYYQIIARNLTLTNVNGACNCIGESFYAFIPEPTSIWNENFTLANGTTSDAAATAWSIANGATAPASAAVNSNQFRVTGADNGQVTWTSQSIDISAYTQGVNVSMNLSESGNLESTDSLLVYYRLNGGALTLFSSNGIRADDFTSAIANQRGLIGSTLQIVIRARYSSSSPSGEEYYWDNVLVNSANSNPVFDEFPPLFICSNQQFTVDHSATDIDGDNIVYSLYTPYDGDNGAGAKDPTFPGNIATFPPVTYLGAYSYTNPLGGNNLVLNSSTGVLTGTPPTVGQFVVGIKATEYRNGVYLSETLRDFQFNVVNCPLQLDVNIINPEPVVCYGQVTTTISAIPTGGNPPYTYLWNNSVTNQTITAVPGVYTVELNDADNCQPVFASVSVISYSVPISANAGPDQTVCSQNPAAVLSGSVAGTSSGYWTGGAGTFTPNNGALNATYTPTAAEITTGHVDLTLTATVNANCPSASDVVRINYRGFQGTLSVSKSNVTCYNSANGSATATVTAGSSPFSYFWSNASTTAAISNLTPATYSITVTDAIGCTSQTVTTITQPNALALNTSIHDVRCNGAATGSISVTPSSGTSPYTYAWSTGATTSSITGRTAGTYTITVRDANTCTISSVLTIAQPTVLAVTTSSTNISCYNGNNGTISSSVTGGTTNYSYNWSSGATSPNLNGLIAGTYSLTVTDFYNCSASTVVTLTQPAELLASTSVTNETCNNLNNGTSTASASGGTSPYRYLWTHNSATTSSVSNLAAGTYTVTVTDAANCTSASLATITEPTALSLSFINQVNVSCNGGNNGSVASSVSGGTANYTYLWSPGAQTSSNISSLVAGTYTVHVTDANACTASISVTITQPTALSVSISKTDESCDYSNNGTATATGAGGTAGYTYLWQPMGSTTAAVTGLSSGTYTVTVTDSRGCTANNTTTITQPTALSVSFASQTNVSCKNGSNGAVTAVPSGGTATYSYAWLPGGATTAARTGLTAGTYTVTARDFQGCTATNTVAITEPTTLTAGTTKTDETCDYSNNGTATVSASGGTAAYTYVWQHNAATTAMVTGLSAGTYSVIATDALGCTANTTATITQPLTLSVSFINQVNVSCNGGNNGSVGTSISGGTANYSYLWSPGGQTTSGRSSLLAGTYTVTVTDANGCTASNSVTITQPTVLSVSISKTDESCNYSNNGTATASGVGGTAAYTYLWQPMASTTASVTSLSSGTYTVTITDNNGCTANNTTTVLQPTALSVSFTSQTNVSCKNGSNGAVTAVPNGGTATYTYAWLPGGATTAARTGLIAGTYTVTATDFQGCIATNTVTIAEPTTLTAGTTKTDETCDYLNNGTATVSASGGTAAYTYVWQHNAATTATVNGLSTGTYSVVATDALGCTANTTATITQPLTLSVSFINQVNVSCNGGNNGSVGASVSGGTANYNYLWSPGGQTTSAINGLSAGTYTVNVTDANGCTILNSVTITQPTTLTLTMSSSIVDCYGNSTGGASVNASGGTSPYSYVWLPGAATTQSLSNVAAGTYTVYVTDDNGCTANNSVTVVQPNPIVLQSGAINTNCAFPNGKAFVSATGGQGTNYKYSWSTGGTTDTITTLASSIYTVTVTDEANCTAFATGNVNDSTAAAPSLKSVTHNLCYGESNGAISIGLTGGVAPYVFNWSSGVIGDSTAANLVAGAYSLTITSGNGCKSFYLDTIVDPTQISSFITTSTVSCFGGSNGTASVIASGGTGAYTYLWSPGAYTGTAISGLAATAYSLEVTDANNCKHYQSFTITEPATSVSVTASTYSLQCFGIATGSVSANAGGGTAPYAYLWQPMNVASQSASNLSPGTYTVNVTDFNMCATTGTITVIQPTDIGLITNSVNSNCSLANGQVSVLASGGAGAYVYQWSPSGSTNATATSLLASTYSVLVTDANGCSKQSSVVVNDNPSPVASVTVVTNVSCNGGNDGSATVSVSGGAAPFTYAWSPSAQTGTVATGLSIGTYSVVVTDNNGCASNVAVSPQITQPFAISSVITTTNVSCFGGSNGQASVTSFGGTGAYNYVWQPSNTSGTSITGLSAGTYTLEVTDANNCSELFTYIIAQPNLLTAAATSTSVSCNAGNNGTANVTAQNGTSPYSYNWLPGNVASQAISNLQQGTYTVTVTDNNLCATTVTVSVIEPTVISLITNSVNSNCSLANGQASVIPSGGMGGYVYQWSPSGGTNATANSLLASTYSILVTDANGCTQQSSVTVNDNPSPIANINAVTNVSCNGGNNGTATVNVTSGSAPFTYAWSPSGGTGTTATGLSIGTYSVVVTDVNGCLSNMAVTPNITQPFAITSVITTTHVGCFGGNDGQATVQSFGGTGAHNYMWQPSNTTGASVSGLVFGTYTLQITDANSCSVTSTYSITQPAEFSTTITVTKNVSCRNGNDGSLSANVTGGNPIFNFTWFPVGGNSSINTGLAAGTYSVLVTDERNCTATSSAVITQPSEILSGIPINGRVSCNGGSDGSAGIIATGGTPSYTYLWSPTGKTSSIADDLSPQIYNVTIADDNGCSAIILVNVRQPSALSGSLSHVDPTCGINNGSVSAMIFGATPPYTYVWSPGNNSTASITSLSAGIYTVQVTDANNCKRVFISNPLNNTIPPTINLVQTSHVKCFGGNDGFAITGINNGTPPYVISWAPYGGNGLTPSSLMAGTYTMSVIDKMNCSTTSSLAITQPTPIAIGSYTQTNVLCYGNGTGAISMSVSGGTAGYNYFWSPSNDNAASIDNLIAGIYSVIVQDQNLCETSLSINITQPAAALTSSVSTTSPLCFGLNGEATASVTGGTPGYNYLWTPALGSTGVSVTLKAGSYTVSVSDNNGCSISNSFLVAEPTQVAASTSSDDTICPGQSTVLTAIASGGVGNYTYNWQPGILVNTSTVSVSPVIDTKYTVGAYDLNGCPSSVKDIDIALFSLTNADVDFSGISPICPNKNSLLSIALSGKTGPVNYSLTPNVGTPPSDIIISPTGTTTYSLTVTSNECGNSISESVTVVVTPQPLMNTSSNINAFCLPGAVQFYDNTLVGNVNDPITSWLWNFGDGVTSTEQNPTHAFNTAGSFSITLTVSTAGGCTANSVSTPLQVDAYAKPTASFYLDTNYYSIPNDGMKITNTSRGASSYLWNFGDGNTSKERTPKYSYKYIGNYEIELIVTSSQGCTDTAYASLVTNADVKFPNAFTPSTFGSNGGIYNMNDLSNDVFFPYTTGVIEYKLEIFDRWGELIFVSADVLQGWDGYYRGAICQMGVYVWKAYVKLNNGKVYNLTGDVSLLR
jgi:hypothetical protein